MCSFGEERRSNPPASNGDRGLVPAIAFDPGDRVAPYLTTNARNRWPSDRAQLHPMGSRAREGRQDAGQREDAEGFHVALPRRDHWTMYGILL